MEKDLQSFITQGLINETNQTLKMQQLLSEKIIGLNEVWFFDWQLYGVSQTHYEYFTKYSLILGNFSNPGYPRIYSVEFNDKSGLEIGEQCNHTINGFDVRTHKTPGLLKNSGKKLSEWLEDCNEERQEDWVIMDNNDLETQKIIGITLLRTAPSIISSSGEYSNSTMNLDIDSGDVALQFNYPAEK